MTRNIKLTLEYDGTDFYGFQLQPKHHTVQESLEKALSKFFDKPMKIASASGRTDAGVHAKNQIVNFKTNRQEPVRQILRGLNTYLPQAIVVRRAEDVKPDFHARFDASGKTYEYCIWNDEARSPFWERYAYHVGQPLNVARMRRAAKFFTGKHDFRSFCATAKPAEKEKDTVRTLKKVLIKKDGSLLRLQFTGDGFLHHMVRNMVGTLLEVGRGKLAPEEIKRILEHRDRRKAAATAPAKGLTLIDVSY